MKTLMAVAAIVLIASSGMAIAQVQPVRRGPPPLGPPQTYYEQAEQELEEILSGMQADAQSDFEDSDRRNRLSRSGSSQANRD